MYENNNIQITVNGQHYLGAAINTKEFIETYAAQMIVKWVSEIDRLAAVAHSYPHAAYTAFIPGATGGWVYLMRTVDVSASIFQPLEDAIHHRVFLL